MTMHTGPHTDDTLRRDIAILSTLAHLHCATVLQLHALCFPYQTLATARITLYYLAEANFGIRTCWRLKRETRERGQIWTLTAKGHDLLRRYVHDVPALTFLDLARPSTSLEHEEWRVRLQVRTLVLRLLLEARRAPLLQCLAVCRRERSGGRHPWFLGHFRPRQGERVVCPRIQKRATFCHAREKKWATEPSVAPPRV